MGCPSHGGYNINIEKNVMPSVKAGVNAPSIVMVATWYRC